MKRLLLFVLGLCSVLPPAWSAAPLFVNDGLFSYVMPPQAAPQIDATVFINRGQFTIANGFSFLTPEIGTLANPPLPFETQNTVAYSNFNVMTGDPGFRFDHYDSATARHLPADTFFNAGAIALADASVFGAEHLIVSAKQIINRGTLATGDAGLLQLSASDTIDLTRSTLLSYGAELDSGAFVQDVYWGVNASGVNGGTTLIPAFPNQFNPRFFQPPVNDTILTPDPFYGSGAWLYLPTNQFFILPGFTTYEQVFQTGANDLTVDALFLTQPNPDISTAVQFLGVGSEKLVQFLAYSTNRVTGQIRTNSLYFSDIMPLYSFQPPTTLGLAESLPSDIYFANYLFDYAVAGFRPAEILPGVTNNVIIGNLFNGGVFSVTRNSPFSFLNPFGVNFFSNITPTPFNPILYFTTNTTPFAVTNCSWGANITAAAFTPARGVQGADYPNMAGRIEINAGNLLDLSNVRIDGVSSLIVNATNHFVGSTNAEIIAPVSNFNLRSTNASMAIVNLTTPTIPRMNGTINCWSGRWTATTNDNTLGFTIHYHVTILDTHLVTESPSKIQNITIHNPNLFVSDILNIFGALSLPDTQRLTITTNPPSSATTTGEINLTDGNLVWSSSFPQLQYLTNYGRISASNSLFFGTATQVPTTGAPSTPYQSIVNHGIIASGGGEQFLANYFETSGSLVAPGAPLIITAGDATITNALLEADTSDIVLSAGSLLVSNDVFFAARTLVLNVTNVLSDGVPSISTLPCTNRISATVTNGNTWRTDFGLTLTTKPTFGDLLGTTVTNFAYTNQSVPITWAGEDRGTTDAGFLNNAALGRLVLAGQTYSVFTFKAAGAANAIYIDSLELTGFTATNVNPSGDFLSVHVDPNMKVYFGQALANGIPVSEKLGQTLNGFIWASNYNFGYFSSTNLLYPFPGDALHPAGTNRVNAALASSCNWDSDGDGILNCQDSSPLIIPPCTLAPTDVPAKALIATQPLPAAVAQNGAASFSVSAPAALSYQWSFNGFAIPGATASTYSIPSVQPGNAGSYSVAIATSLGPIFSSEALLSVTSATDSSGSGGSSTNLVVGPPQLDLRPASLINSGATNFALAQGTYNGLFADTNGVSLASSGYFSVRTTARKTYSGKLMLGGRTFSFSGSFGNDGSATNSMRRGSGLSNLSLRLQLDLSGDNQISGLISDGHWSATLLADRPNPVKAKAPPKTYTVILAPPGTNSLFGFGYGTVNINAAGSLNWAGTLADGTKVSQATTLSGEGFWPLYSSLYAGKGSLMSWMLVSTNLPSADLAGDVIWLKSAAPKTKFYSTGFTNIFTALGSGYSRPTAGSRALNLPTGSLVFSGGGLAPAFTNSISLDVRNRVSSNPTNRLSMTINAVSGLFQGHTFVPGSTKPISFQGVLFPKTTNAFGLFLGASQSGAVYLRQ